MNEENGRVECRLRPVLWLGIVVIGVMGFGLASLPFLPDGQGNPPDIHRNPVAPFVWSATFTLLSLGCVVAFALYVLRARIIADENGLRWRDIRKELFARWDEVTDFYDSPLSSTRTHGRVETVAGKLSLEDFTNQEKLRAYIQSHATNAASREWKVKDPQRTKEIESWPQEFGYNVFWNNVLRLSVLAFLLCFCGLAIWQMWATLFVEPISFQLRILGVVAALFVGAIPVLLFVAHFIMWKNVRKRFGERIVITPQNIVFIDRTRQVEARWDEVTNYYIERTGGFAGANYVVETTRGNWSFSNDISRFLVLKQLFSIIKLIISLYWILLNKISR